MAYRTIFMQLPANITLICNNSLHNVSDVCKLLCNAYFSKQLYRSVDTCSDGSNNRLTAKQNVQKFTLNSINTDSVKNDLNRTDLTVEGLNEHLVEALNAKKMCNINHWTTLCVRDNVLPPISVLERLFVIYSNLGNIAMVKSLQTLHRNSTQDPKSFNHHLAKAHWVKGNVKESYSLLFDMYKYDKSMKFHIRGMLRNFIRHNIQNSSEASIVITKQEVIKFASQLNEWSPIMDFWEVCWLSEWYRDNQLADELFNKYDMLRLKLRNRLAFVASTALKSHCENSVRDLLEALLRHEMRLQYALVIGVLFDYKYKYDDIRACEEIVKNCRVLNITLSQLHYEKYLLMKITTDKSSPIKKERQPTVKNFKYIF